MDVETKQRWVAALRSGQYKQGHQRLRTDDKYCCLGVFCDLFGGGFWEKKPNSLSGIYWYMIPDSDQGPVGALPPHKLYVDHQIQSHHSEYLVAMNDYYKNSFTEIADYIEANM
jgi:hypothetical protein